MEQLFGGRGGPKTCWCMVWRNDADGNAASERAPLRRAAMERLVARRQTVGILGYDGISPVAWCSVAPRAAFGKGLSPTTSDSGLWSLTCFFIRRDHRNQGGFAALLTAAETFAAAAGATVLAAYPVAPDSPSYRFSGFVPSFENAGYLPVTTVGTRRHAMRKSLS